MIEALGKRWKNSEKIQIATAWFPDWGEQNQQSWSLGDWKWEESSIYEWYLVHDYYNARKASNKTDCLRHIRGKTLRIYGVPEGVEIGSLSITHSVEKLLCENLNLPPLTPLQIQRAHRALLPPPWNGAQPRSIQVKVFVLHNRGRDAQAGMAEQRFSVERKQNKPGSRLSPRDDGYEEGVCRKRKTFDSGPPSRHTWRYFTKME